MGEQLNIHTLGRLLTMHIQLLQYFTQHNVTIAGVTSTDMTPATPNLQWQAPQENCKKNYKSIIPLRISCFAGEI